MFLRLCVLFWVMVEGAFAFSVYDLADVIPLRNVSDKPGANLWIRKDSTTEELFRFLKAGSSPITCEGSLCRFSVNSGGEIFTVVESSDSLQSDSRKHGLVEISQGTTDQEERKHIRLDRDAANYLFQLLKSDASNKVDGNRILGKHIVCGVPNQKGATRLTCDLDVDKDGVPREIPR